MTNLPVLKDSGLPALSEYGERLLRRINDAYVAGEIDHVAFEALSSEVMGADEKELESISARLPEKYQSDTPQGAQGPRVEPGIVPVDRSRHPREVMTSLSMKVAGGLTIAVIVFLLLIFL